MKNNHTFLNKGDPPVHKLDERTAAIKESLEEARRVSITREHLKEAEKQALESVVRFPLSDMFSFARRIFDFNQMTPRDQWDDYNIFSVQFLDFSPTGNQHKGMFSVRMHCQTTRFEEFVDRYGAVITRVNPCGESLHVDACVKDDAMGWFEVTAIYSRDSLKRCEDSVFEDVDSLRDLFMIHATLKDWTVSEDA